MLAGLAVTPATCRFVHCGQADLVTAERGADRGGRDLYAKPEQLPLDALISPALGSDPRGGGRTFNRAKLVCACYPERGIRVSPKQAARGSILCGACGKESLPQDDPG